MSEVEYREPFADFNDLCMILGEIPHKKDCDTTELLHIVSDCLRFEAEKVGKNLDEMITKNRALAQVAKSVVADVVGRYLSTSTNQEPMTQVSH